MAPATKRGLNAERIRQLAVTGADTLLKQLRAEIIAIERTFPELALPQRRRDVRRGIKTVQSRTRQMSAAARKAVSARMTKYCTKPLRGRYYSHHAAIAA